MTLPLGLPRPGVGGAVDSNRPSGASAQTVLAGFRTAAAQGDYEIRGEGSRKFAIFGSGAIWYPRDEPRERPYEAVGDQPPGHLRASANIFNEIVGVCALLSLVFLDSPMCWWAFSGLLGFYLVTKLALLSWLRRDRRNRPKDDTHLVLDISPPGVWLLDDALVVVGRDESVIYAKQTIERFETRSRDETSSAAKKIVEMVVRDERARRIVELGPEEQLPPVERLERWASV